jgi:hypothetical protein
MKTREFNRRLMRLMLRLRKSRARKSTSPALMKRKTPTVLRPRLRHKRQRGILREILLYRLSMKA